MGRQCSSILFWETKIWKWSVSISQSLHQRNGLSYHVCGNDQKKKEAVKTADSDNLPFNAKNFLQPLIMGQCCPTQHKEFEHKENLQRKKMEEQACLLSFFQLSFRLPWKSKHWAGNEEPGKASGLALKTIYQCRVKDRALQWILSSIISAENDSTFLPSSNLQEQEFHGYLEGLMSCLLLSG